MPGGVICLQTGSVQLHPEVLILLGLSSDTDTDLTFYFYIILDLEKWNILLHLRQQSLYIFFSELFVADMMPFNL